MAILTEAGNELITEASQRLLAENETDAVLLPPQGLGARFQVIKERYTKAVLLNTLQLWVMATPPELRVSVRVDDGPAFEPNLIRENPNGALPAIYTADYRDFLPRDGMTHIITVSAWITRDRRSSAVTTTRLAATLPADPVPMPEWIGARIVRQTSSEWPDLIEINWRATTPVILMANLRKGASSILVRIGVSDQSPLLVEGLSAEFSGNSDDKLYPVYIGAIGVKQGRESPPLWSNSPLQIKHSRGKPTGTPQTPDQIAGTAREVFGLTEIGRYQYCYNCAFHSEIEAAVRAALGTLPSNAMSIIDRAICRLFWRIKDHLRKDEAVILDDFGRFYPRWLPARTSTDPITGAQTTIPAKRKVAFMPSAGFRLGTKTGMLLTDAQAQAQEQ